MVELPARLGHAGGGEPVHPHHASRCTEKQSLEIETQRPVMPAASKMQLFNTDRGVFQILVRDHFVPVENARAAAKNHEERRVRIQEAAAG